MQILATDAAAQPMLFVTTTTPMAAIPSVMGQSFDTLGQFFAKAGIKPIGPPLAVYHDWAAGQTTVDVGFPVTEASARKASGAVMRGTTPSGPALKVVHVGANDGLPATYAALDEAMNQAHVPESTRMWEVYIGEPGAVPDAELVTEIYAAVTAADAAKFH
jgi:effector-binding domain-containing protein